jgi:hypothetical protein
MNQSVQDRILIASLQALSSRVNFAFQTILCPIGMVLTILAVPVYFRKKMQKTNMGYLHFWQSMVDLCMLSLVVLMRQLADAFETAVTNRSDFLCRSLVFMGRFTPQISSWMNVFICFDRFVFIFYTNTV